MEGCKGDVVILRQHEATLCVDLRSDEKQILFDFLREKLRRESYNRLKSFTVLLETIFAQFYNVEGVVQNLSLYCC